MSKLLAESSGVTNNTVLELRLLERGVLGMAGRRSEVGVLDGVTEGNWQRRGVSSALVSCTSLLSSANSWRR